MGRRPGPAPKLRAVKELEGNPGRRPIKPGVKLPPASPSEPDWLQTFPAIRTRRKPAPPPPGPGRLRKDATDVEREAHAYAKSAHLAEVLHYREELRVWENTARLRAESARCREVARAAWREIVPVLDAIGILSLVDAQQIADYCICVARIDQCERDLATRGLWIQSDRQPVRNPTATILHQFRRELAGHVADFGLSPLARDRLNMPEPDHDSDGLFDWD